MERSAFLKNADETFENIDSIVANESFSMQDLFAAFEVSIDAPNLI